jgi:phosphoribosylanthranilate isomerase
MVKTIVQIYEVQRPVEAAAVVALGVDHVGSVLLSAYKCKEPWIRKTVRTVQQAGAVSVLIPLFGDPVAVFQALDYYQPDIVHFCEALSILPEGNAKVVCEFDSLLSLQIDVKDRFPQIEIMRSLPVPRPGMARENEILKNIFTFAELLAPLSDYFLIDTVSGTPGGIGNQPVAGYVGITGEVGDWKIAGAIIKWSPIPVILAGGISSQNVYDAIIKLRPAGVDSCTKTNAVDNKGRPIRFKKDLEKVKALVAEVRRAEMALSGLQR